jgi:hypothetical protein
MKLECLRDFSMRIGKRFYVKSKGDMFDIPEAEGRDLVLAKLVKEYVEPVVEVVKVAPKQRKKKVVADAFSNE